MEKIPMKTETASPDMEAEATPDDISQQDQNAQLFIEALLQASQNQLLTESAVLAMNQLWMGSRGALAQSGAGNISLAGPGNISLITPGNISLTRPSNIPNNDPGNISLVGSGNLQLSREGSILCKIDENTSVEDQGNIVLDSPGNIQVGSHGNLQPGLLGAVQFSSQVPLLGTNNDFLKEDQGEARGSHPVKDSHIKQALAAPLRISQMGMVIASGDSQVKVRQIGSKVSEAASLPSNLVSDTLASDFSISDVPDIKQSYSGKVELYADSVIELMDTSEGTVGGQAPHDSVEESSSTEHTSNENINKSTSPPASSPKKKPRRQSSSTSHVTDGSITPSGGAKSQPAQEKSDTGNRATTPRRRGSHLSEGGGRSRPLSECEGDLTPDAPPHLSAYSSDDLRRQMAGSVTPDTDLGFQPSMLEAVLTEKKLALLRSPEVRQFLQQQQMQRAKERKLTHSSRGSCSKGDNST